MTCGLGESPKLWANQKTSITALVDLDTRVKRMGGQGTDIFGLRKAEEAANNLTIIYMLVFRYDPKGMMAYITDK